MFQSRPGRALLCYTTAAECRLLPDSRGILMSVKMSSDGGKTQGAADKFTFKTHLKIFRLSSEAFQEREEFRERDDLVQHFGNLTAHSQPDAWEVLELS